MRTERKIQLEETCISQHLRGELASHGGKLIGRSKYLRNIAIFVVSRRQWALPGLGDDLRTPVQEAHQERSMKNVLIKTGKEKCAIAADRPAQRKSKLLLLIVWLEIQKRMSRAEVAVSKIIEIRTMQLVRSRLGDHVYHRAPRTP